MTAARTVKTPASQLEAWSVTWAGSDVEGLSEGRGMRGSGTLRPGLFDPPADRVEWGRLVGRLLALLWALGMGVLGLAMLIGQPSPLIVASSPAAPSLGIAGIAGGWFVFLVLVADAWFPRAWRGLAVGSEVIALLVFLCSLGFAIITLA